jgi:glycine dehydrogenase subunit 2
MTNIRQAKWLEPLIFTLGASHRRGCQFACEDSELLQISEELDKWLPKALRRENPPALPELSEVEVVRHFTRLSQINFSVDTGFYPLGSCTMKYNPKINEVLANNPSVKWLHPHQDESTVQGALELMYHLAQWLSEITGMHQFSLAPYAGAHGEYTGTLIIRAYHEAKGELHQRQEILVPDTAHGTNYTSAAMAGFKVIVVPSTSRGCVDSDALRQIVSEKTAGLMLTNPNTLGLFEENILEISQIIHDTGGLLYYDGANLNAILGQARPRDMGFDIVHVNLHKTFSTPHGGGGPGAGPVGVVESLQEFLPIPIVEQVGNRYRLNYDLSRTIGHIGGFYGNFAILVRAYAYILSMGAEGLIKVSELCVLNANYLARQISEIRGFSVPYGKDRLVKHEFVVSCQKLHEETGVTAKHVAKRLLDFGIHAPTMYFPPVIKEALMIEPTETESIETLNSFISAFQQISDEAYTTPNLVLTAPHSTARPLLDEVKASHPRTICLSWRTMNSL